MDSNSGSKELCGEGLIAASPPLRHQHRIVPSREQKSHIFPVNDSKQRVWRPASNPQNPNFTRIPDLTLDKIRARRLNHVAIQSHFNLTPPRPNCCGTSSHHLSLRNNSYTKEKKEGMDPEEDQPEDLASLGFTSFGSRNKRPKHRHRPSGSNSNSIPLPPPPGAAEVTTFAGATGGVKPLPKKPEFVPYVAPAFAPYVPPKYAGGEGSRGGRARGGGGDELYSPRFVENPWRALETKLGIRAGWVDMEKVEGGGDGYGGEGEEVQGEGGSEAGERVEVRMRGKPTDSVSVGRVC